MRLRITFILRIILIINTVLQALGLGSRVHHLNRAEIQMLQGLLYDYWYYQLTLNVLFLYLPLRYV